MCYLKGLVSVYFRCLAKAVGFSETHLYLCLQPATLSDAQAPPTSWLGEGTRGLQPGGENLLAKVTLEDCSILESVSRKGMVSKFSSCSQSDSSAAARRSKIANC